MIEVSTAGSSPPRLRLPAMAREGLSAGFEES